MNHTYYKKSSTNDFQISDTFWSFTVAPLIKKKNIIKIYKIANINQGKDI